MKIADEKIEKGVLLSIRSYHNLTHLGGRKLAEQLGGLFRGGRLQFPFLVYSRVLGSPFGKEGDPCVKITRPWKKRGGKRTAIFPQFLDFRKKKNGILP